MRHIFDDISDPIMLIDQSGIHSYSNKAAKSLSITNDISKIGSKDFQKSLHQILDKEIDTPVLLQLNDDLGIGADFEVKVMIFQSFFILHFLSHNSKNHIGILKHRLMLLLKDELEKPLNELFYSTELLLESVREIKITNKIKELLNKTLEDGSELMDSLSKIKMLGDLYTDQDIQNKQKITVLSLLNDAIERLDSLIIKKSLSVKIETTGSEVTNIYCSKVWLLLAVRELMREVMRYAKAKDEIKVKIHLHGYFATIKITNTPVLNPLNFHNLKQEGAVLQTPIIDDVENNLNFNLFLAHRVVQLHGGNLKQISSNGYQSIIIELPLGSTNQVNELDGLKQAKLYAADLAILKKELAMKNPKEF